MTEITCSKYTKQVGDSKRCVHFLQGGACALPNELMCSEWLKVNQPKPPDPPRQEKSQIFGFLGDVLPCMTSTDSGQPANAAPQAPAPGPVGPEALRGGSTPETPATRPQTVVSGAQVYSEQRAKELRDIPLEQMSLEAVESLTKLGIETLVSTNSDMGEVWLVPEYTEKNRNELTYRDTRYLMLVVKVFPGSVLKTVRRPQEQ